MTDCGKKERFMKKICILLILGLLLQLFLGSQPMLGTNTGADPSAKAISVRIQSEEILFEDQPPIIYQDRVLVPLRQLLESCYVQAKVLWEEKSQTAAIFDQRGYRVLFKPGDPQYRVIDAAGEIHSYTLDVPAMLLNGRLLIPLRVLLETFEYYVTWYPDIYWVEIKDSLPAWRKLKSLKDWQEELAGWHQELAAKGGDCLPCLLKAEN